MTKRPQWKRPSHALDENEVDTFVHSTWDADHLVLTFGRQPMLSPLARTVLLVAVPLAILAAVVGAGGAFTAVMIAALAAWAISASTQARERLARLAGRRPDQIRVTPHSVTTTLPHDPYINLRPTGSTNDFPEFTPTVRRSELAGCYVAEAPTSRGWGPVFEIRLATKDGVEHVMAVERTKVEAVQIVSLLRRQLEISTDPDRVVESLRDAVIKGPRGFAVIPEDEARPRERDR